MPARPSRFLTGAGLAAVLAAGAVEQAVPAYAGPAAAVQAGAVDVVVRADTATATAAAKALVARGGGTIKRDLGVIGGFAAVLPPATLSALAATGLGSLEKARGSAHVYDSGTGAVLTGEKDIFGKTWNAVTWSLASRTQNSWQNGTFNGTVWTGSTYGASVHNEKSWAGVTWSGRSWAGSTWSGRTWAGAVWTGRSWAGQTWSGRTWSGRSWASAGWTGEPWQ